MLAEAAPKSFSEGLKPSHAQTIPLRFERFGKNKNPLPRFFEERAFDLSLFSARLLQARRGR
jgi:hypothetical protein